MLIDDRIHGSKKVEASTSTKSQTSFVTITDFGDTDQLYQSVAICALPDDVLLEIFKFYMDFYFGEDLGEDLGEDCWHTLVHVCRQWRWVVFASPRRLNLRLLCTNRRPVHNALDVWPQLPIVIRNERGMSRPQDTKNMVAALKQRNRVCMIFICSITKALLRRIGAIREPLPELTDLVLRSSLGKVVPVLPDSFLGGSAPSLNKLWLDGIPFPALPKLLMSTHHLVTLRLRRIPHSGFNSPEAMVTALSTLTSLKFLELLFRSPRSQADRASRLPPPLTRIILPALTSLTFKGDSEYLEDVVSRFEAPLLSYAQIIFFNQLIFNTPLLRHFIASSVAQK